MYQEVSKWLVIGLYPNFQRDIQVWPEQTCECHQQNCGHLGHSVVYGSLQHQQRRAQATQIHKKVNL